MILERIVRINEILRSAADGSARACLSEAVRFLTTPGAFSELLGPGFQIPGRVDHVGFLLPPGLEREFLAEVERSGLRSRRYPSSVVAREIGRPAHVVEAMGAFDLLVEAIVPESDDGLVRAMAESGRSAHFAIRLSKDEDLRSLVSILGEIGFRPAPFSGGATMYSEGADMSVIYLDGTSKAGRLRVELCVRTVAG